MDDFSREDLALPGTGKRSIFDSIGICEAYSFITGHAPEGVEKRGEIRVRCLSPEHTDNSPSLDLNPAKDAFICRTHPGEQYGGGVAKLAILAGLARTEAEAARFYESKLGVSTDGQTRKHKRYKAQKSNRASAKVVSYFVASFVYVNPEDSSNFLRNERREPAWDGSPKGFYPYMADPTSETGFRKDSRLPKGTIVPLYHADELRQTIAAGGVVYLLEGEGKADRLRAALATITPAEDAGLVCVTTAFGGGGTDKHFTPHLAQLAGASLIIVWADSSPTGRKNANRRAQAIKTAHPHMFVKVLDAFHDRNGDEDAVEWFDGDAESGLAPRNISDLRSLVNATPYVEGPSAQSETIRSDKDDANADEDWGELAELPEIKLTAPTLPEDLIPLPIRRWVVDCARRHNVYPEMVLGPYLSAAAAAVGSRCVVIPERDNPLWKVRLDSLWNLNIGKPSSLKTSVFGEAVGALHRLETQAHEKHEKEMQEYSKLLQAIKDEISALESAARAKSGEEARKSLAEKREELRELERNIPIRRRYIVDDATPEALVEILRQNPRGVLVSQDEIKGLIDTFSRKGREGERQLYLKAWNHFGPHTVDRIGRGNKFIPSLGFCLSGASQPSKIRPTFEEAREDGGDGFIARFQLIAYPDGQPDYQRCDRAPDYEAKRVAYKIIEYLDTFNPVDIGAEQVADEDYCTITFDDEAQGQFDRWRTDLENKLRKDQQILGSPGFEAALGKYRSFLPALAGLVCLLGVAISEGQRKAPINAEQTRQAAMLAEFYRQHLLKVYRIGATSPGRRLWERILWGQVQDKQTVREVGRKGWTDLGTGEAVKAAIEEIKALNVCRIEEGEKKSLIIRIHPELRKQGGSRG